MPNERPPIDVAAAISIATAALTLARKAFARAMTPGEPGKDGLRGARGPRGLSGDQGDLGKRGERGLRGNDGDRGLRGHAGDKGDAGEQGKRGDRGIQGNRGEVGDKGERGLKGDKGEPGPKGDKGDPPEHRWIGTELQFRNPDGSWGRRTDLEGPRGRGGMSGTTVVVGGDTGGGTGENGLSAYQLALLDGFEGSLSEWLDSLVGPPGPGGAGSTYTYEQLAPADLWMVGHGLGRFPSVTIVSLDGEIVETDVRYIDNDNVQVEFDSAFSGRAYLN